MKFYYNETLIRSSKTHVYTHAVIDVKSGRVLGCRSNEETAQSIITGAINTALEAVENSKSHLKAIENGSRSYKIKEGRRNYYLKCDADAENVKYWLKRNEDCVDYIKENYKVVELEMREA